MGWMSRITVQRGRDVVGSKAVVVLLQLSFRRLDPGNFHDCLLWGHTPRCLWEMAHILIPFNPSTGSGRTG